MLNRNEERVKKLVKALVNINNTFNENQLRITEDKKKKP